MSVVKVIDVIFIIFIFISMVKGYVQGLVQMIAHFGALIITCILARVVAVGLSDSIAKKVVLPMIEQSMKTGTGLFHDITKHALHGVSYQIAYFIIYAVLFLGIGIACAIVIRFTKLINHVPVIGMVNRIGGLLVGLLWAFVIIFVISYVIFHFVPKEMLHQWGFTKQALRQTLLLGTFQPK